MEKIMSEENEWDHMVETDVFFVFCICSYLSSIHEKANCIAIFWTGRPHSLGSCHFLRCLDLLSST